MPAELSILTRYPCLVAKCEKYFRLKIDYDAHKLNEHGMEPLRCPDQNNDEPEEHECTYPSCHRVFKTKSEMIRHKQDDSRHYYCTTCDVDFRTYTAQNQHIMNSDKHSACPVCGSESATTIGGIRLHVNQAHPANKELKCPGCSISFDSTTAFVRHILQRHCSKKNPMKGITYEEFQGRVMAWHGMTVIARYQYLHGTSYFGDTGDAVVIPCYGTAADEPALPTYTTPSGDEIEWGGEQPCWNDQQAPSWSEGAPAPRNVNMAWGETQQSWDTTQSTWGVEKLAVSEQGTAQSSGSNSSNNKSSSNNAQGAWGKSSNAAKTLFPDAKPIATKKQPARPTEADYIKHKDKIWATEYGTPHERFNLQTLNPCRREFDPCAFFQGASQKYYCPYEECFYKTTSPEELTLHMRKSPHFDTHHACGHCNYHANNYLGLVAHTESLSKKCNMGQNKMAWRNIEKLTGGYITVHKGKAWNNDLEPNEARPYGKTLLHRIRCSQPKYEVVGPSAPGGMDRAHE